MKKFLPDFFKIKILCLATSFLAAGLVINDKADAAITGLVTTSGRNFYVNGQNFKSIGVNRYNLLTLSGSGCGGSFSDNELTVWFSELAQMKVTTARFWMFQSFTKSGSDLSRFNKLLSLAQQYNVKLIPVFENHWGDCTQGGEKTSSWYSKGYLSPYGSYPLSLKNYIKKIVPLYKDNPNILMWQIMNEAESSDSTALYNFAKDVSGYIKSLDQNHIVSFGTMGSGQIPSSLYKSIHSLSTIDILEYHDYNAESTALPSTLVKRIDDSIVLNKPLFIGESGISLNDYSPKQRADYFDNKMKAFYQNGGTIYVIWSYRDKGTGEQGYSFNITDPLVQVIQKQIAAFTPNPTITPGPTQTITSTTAPIDVQTVTTSYSQKLGGVKLYLYCHAKGFDGAKINNNSWTCSPSGPVINMDNVCQWQYNTVDAIGRQSTPGDLYSYQCYK